MFQSWTGHYTIKGWVFFMTLCSFAGTGNKHKWTLDFRMNIWCPSPEKSSVVLHHPTVHLVWASCRGVSKVYALFDGSMLWIQTVTPMLGYLLETFQRPGKRGIYQASTRFPELSCPPRRMKGRSSRTHRTGSSELTLWQPCDGPGSTQAPESGLETKKLER